MLYSSLTSKFQFHSSEINSWTASLNVYNRRYLFKRHLIINRSALFDIVYCIQWGVSVLKREICAPLLNIAMFVSRQDICEELCICILINVIQYFIDQVHSIWMVILLSLIIIIKKFKLRLFEKKKKKEKHCAKSRHFPLELTRIDYLSFKYKLALIN